MAPQSEEQEGFGSGISPAPERKEGTEGVGGIDFVRRNGWSGGKCL